MDYKQTLSDAIKKLENKKIKTPRLDAEVLLSHTIKKPREFILTHLEKKLTPQQLINFNNFIKRRLKNEPIAYITKQKEFYGLDFKVNSSTLIPRPETEHLVEAVLKKISTIKQLNNLTILDIGTGSGNIIISIAKNNEQQPTINSKIKYFGIDISEKALNVAKQNAKRNKVYNKIEFIKSDLLNYFIKNKKRLLEIGDWKLVIVCNLPYLEIGWKNKLENSETKGLNFEPKIALYSGKDGLDDYRKLAEQVKFLSGKINKNITLICEIGHLQKKEMKKIFSFTKNIEFQKDLAKKWRVALIEI